jgi:single-stranded DNA-specific DHH superfamily exonuclease
MNSLSIYIISFLSMILLVLNVHAQESDNRLSDDQYKVVESLFSGNTSQKITIFHNTIDFKSWIELIELKFKQNAIPCSFEESALEEIIKEFKIAASAISIKTIEQNRLPFNVELTQSLLKERKNGLNYSTRSISEPIIVGNNAFVFNKQHNEETLILFKKDNKKRWVFNCFVEFYLVIDD